MTKSRKIDSLVPILRQPKEYESPSLYDKPHKKKHRKHKKPTRKVKDFYATIPKEYLTEYNNPHYDIHGFEVPFRACICGGSGTKKGSTLLNIIEKMPDTFNKVILCIPNSDEPLYNWAERTLGDLLEIYQGIENIPQIEDLEDYGSVLIIFDDFVCNTEREQTLIKEYFMRSRKGSDGISCIYITQSFFDTPSFVRKQLSDLVLKKLSDSRDLSEILRRCSIGNKELLVEIYRVCTDNPDDFLMIHMKQPSENMFWKSFQPMIIPNI